MMREPLSRRAASSTIIEIDINRKKYAKGGMIEMADEKTDNCEIQFSSPLGGYGTPDNTGLGVMSGAVSHTGRGTESEAKKKEGFFEKRKNRKSEG